MNNRISHILIQIPEICMFISYINLKGLRNIHLLIWNPLRIYLQYCQSRWQQRSVSKFKTWQVIVNIHYIVILVTIFSLYNLSMAFRGR